MGSAIILRSGSGGSQRSGGEAVQRRSISAVGSPEGPWAKVDGPFFRRHPQLSERSCRIKEATRVIADDAQGSREFCTKWQDLINTLQPSADHVWNTDKTGEAKLRFTVQQ